VIVKAGINNGGDFGSKWQDFLAILQSSSSNAPNSSSSTVENGMGNSTVEWTCRHCTFINPPTQRDCEMCGLPKE